MFGATVAALLYQYVFDYGQTADRTTDVYTKENRTHKDVMAEQKLAREAKQEDTTRMIAV